VKRAADAVGDGDRILAVIKGGAVRHSGRTNSLTAPNPDAQADVIVAAVADAGIDPLSIGYVEAHGTGTPLGDPIEANGLKKAFRRLHGEHGRTNVAPHFTVGSVKAQIGHLEAAAGLAGLLKAVLALHHRALPGSPYLTELNPHIDLADAPFRFSSETAPWHEPALPGQPRRAGVSSFGFGGVNAHVVLEERPTASTRTSTAAATQLFVLSARTAEALRARASALAAMLATEPWASDAAPSALADLALTLRRKTPLAHRLAIVARSASELAAHLQAGPEAGPQTASGIAQAGTHEAMGLFASEAEVEERLRALVASGELHKLAALWVKGFAIEWDRIMPLAGAALVTTPAYPFARESFWVNFGQADAPVAARSSTATRATAAAAAPAKWALYSEAWAERPLSEVASREPRTEDEDKPGAVIALVSGPTGRRIAELVDGGRRVLIVAVSDSGAAGALVAAAGRISGLLDLTALDGEFDRTSVTARQTLDLVRQLIGPSLKKGEHLDVLQATLGLQRAGNRPVPITLSGAQAAGIYKSLWAEYRRCRSKTVDFDPTGFTPETAAAAIAREINRHDGPSELVYQGGTRMARVMAPVRATLPEPQPEPGGVALVTGGTGAIGLALARDLAARGFRALLLTGRRELNADQNAVIDGLTRHGVAISFYRGDLCDEAALRESIRQFRAAHGFISHVYHCAGAVSQKAPAFFQKTAASMADVLQPKVDALWTLHRVLAGGPPRVFVLFSSVSAVAPKLASGVLDYAAANRFLDLFAQYQHARGQTQYRSIQWARWRQMGLARDVREDGAGGSALDAAQCFEALHRVEAAEELGPLVCVAAEGTPMLATSALERPAVAQGARPATTATAVSAGDPRSDTVRQELRTIVASELEIEESKLSDEASFDELGIDSIVLIDIVARIEKWLATTVDPSELIKRNSIAAVAHYLVDLHDPQRPGSLSQPSQPEPTVAFAAPAVTSTAASPVAPMSPTAAPPSRTAPVPASRHGFPVAVIGIACRFPGAIDKETFWRNLVGGVDSVSTVPPSRWEAQAFYARHHEPGKTVSQWGGFIDDVERVNPALFGLGAEAAADVDPLIRLFTETSLAAVLDSSSDPASMKGRRVGVFAGARMGRYAERIVSPTKTSVTGVGQNFISAYVSHLLDLRGPSLVLDCACSSSLAAVHTACQSLQTGDSEMAIAGGVDLLLDEKSYLFLSAAHALSPDGRCRTFDERANGFVPGEGVGCVVLQPLAQAVADGNHVYAVIDGSAINNDGHTLGVTTPGVDGQVDVIERAWQRAGAPPSSASYVEAHGTGTMIGDPIELRALSRAFASDPPAHCAIGSVKTNVGHLLSAAGIASFIKVVLSLHHRTLPPTLHCEQVNPRFDFDRTPFRPVVESRPWAPQAGVRRAGISAFGFGKTNVHVVVSERPEGARRPVDLPAAKPAVENRDKIYAWRASTSAPAPSSAAPVAVSSHQLLALESFTCETVAEA
jgi:acyl transferase domain-containing protein/NAD(P)-dependent dehydrogenase (short-subunit alcohol dehydrogenase family)